jgi:hypothetical protein
MTGPITRHRDIESLKIAARWPGADRLPAVLCEHPTAVVPYLVTHDHFTERLYHQHTGYWQPAGRGLDPATAAEHAAALDLLAGGRAEQFAAAATTLIGQGDELGPDNTY